VVDILVNIYNKNESRLYCNYLYHIHYIFYGGADPFQHWKEWWREISDQIKIHIPDKDEFFKIFKTVLFFSCVSGLLSAYIIKHHL